MEHVSCVIIVDSVSACEYARERRMRMRVDENFDERIKGKREKSGGVLSFKIIFKDTHGIYI